jgi:caffeoyl-CoA O-methyltransferase
LSEFTKSIGITPELHEYVIAHGTPPDEIQRALIEETREKIGGLSLMQVSPDEGAFLAMLVRLTRARFVVEVGTFTGYSALCMARALPDDGRLLCCDVSEEWTSIGVPYWEKSGVRPKIDLRIAPAIETLRALPADPPIDFAFIDADKSGYWSYYEEILGRLRPGGVIAVDNVMWAGQVVADDDQSEMTLAIRDFNDRLAADERVEKVMLPVADGVTLVRKP